MLLSIFKDQTHNGSLNIKWKKIIFILIIGLIILFEAQGEGDFKIFLSASEDLFLQKNIFKLLYNDWYHYYYSVLFAILLYPLTFLPLYIAKVIWLITNVFFVVRIWKVIISWLPVKNLSSLAKNLFYATSFIFIFRFLLNNFHLAQMTIFILFLTLEGLRLILIDRQVLGSFFIALGIDVKLLPIVFIGYLIYRRQWKATFYIIGFVILFLFLPVLFIGIDYNNFLLLERWHLINPINQEHLLDTSERSFHSITTFLAVLLVEDCGDYHALNLRRHITNITFQNLFFIINIVRLVLVFFALYFLRSRPFEKPSSKIQTLYEISYICLLIPLIFPHQQHYAFFFIFPATSYLMFYLVYLFHNKKGNFTLKSKVLILMAFISFILTSSHLVLGQFNDYYDHFKTLTYGIILIIILLACCRPIVLVREIKKVTLLKN